MKLPQWLRKACVGVYEYFHDRIYEKHFFRLMLFKNKEYVTFRAISHAKRLGRSVWIGNNILLPLIVVFSPLIFTLIHYSFGTIPFHKSIVEVAIGGGITLIGFNVLRSASTLISEKLDESKIPEDLKDAWQEASNEIKGIKSNLRMRATIFSFVGAILYFIQAAQLITACLPDVYWYLAGISLISLISIILGRFMFLLETNFLDDRSVVEIVFKSLRTQNNEFESLKSQLTKQGLIL